MKKGMGHIHKLLYLLLVIRSCSTAHRQNYRSCHLNRCRIVQANFTEKTDYNYLSLGILNKTLSKFIIRSSNVWNY